MKIRAAQERKAKAIAEREAIQVAQESNVRALDALKHLSMNTLSVGRP